MRRERNFVVEIDRVSDYTMQETEKMVKRGWKNTLDKTVKRIK